MKVVGELVAGVGDFRERMTLHAGVFRAVVGEDLFLGTLNVHVPEKTACREDFQIKGADIGEPE